MTPATMYLDNSFRLLAVMTEIGSGLANAECTKFLTRGPAGTKRDVPESQKVAEIRQHGFDADG